MNAVTHGAYSLIDSLKTTLISKYLEASTDLFFSIAIVLMMLRTLFVQRVFYHCESEPALRRALTQMESNLSIRRLRPNQNLSADTVIIKHMMAQNTWVR
jgi:hypothetical protein